MEQHSEDPEEKKKWVSDLKEALEKYNKEAKDDMEKDRKICQVPDRTSLPHELHHHFKRGLQEHQRAGPALLPGTVLIAGMMTKRTDGPNMG